MRLVTLYDLVAYWDVRKASLFLTGEKEQSPVGVQIVRVPLAIRMRKGFHSSLNSFLLKRVLLPMNGMPESLYPAWIADLKVKDPSVWNNAVSFLRGLTEKDKIAVLYDDDGDGISAAASVIVGIEALTGRFPDIVSEFGHSNEYISSDLPRRLKTEGVTKIITVDKSVDQKGLAFMQELEVVAPVLVIDHHKINTPYQSDRFILLKPQLVWETEPSSFPTAILAYTLFSVVVDLSSKDWVACIGITSDSSYPRWKNWVDTVAQKWDLPVIPEDPFKGSFGVMSRMIYSTGVLSAHQIPEFLDLLVEAERPQNVLESGFFALLSILDDEVEQWMKKLETEIIIEPEIELVIAKVWPKHGIKSLLINRLSRERYPDKSLLLMQDLGGVRVLISGRRQDFKVPMNDLMEKAIKDLPESSGGGHIPAAAASIRKQDEEQFLANVRRLLATELKRKD